ncbi:MAG: TniB family NTP-binding protein [Candidatus Heimdallarchaeota archaeon]|nr:TniB family NTP-binding protein [Candidatus Heimdallarchaeota archaeon]
MEYRDIINEFTAEDMELGYSNKALEIIKYRPYFGYSQANVIMREYLIKAWEHAIHDPTNRPMAYYLMGYINSGKSFLLERFKLWTIEVLKKSQRNYDLDNDKIVIYYNTPSHVRSAKGLIADLLATHFGLETRASIRKNSNTQDFLRVLRREFKIAGTKLLIIDELQDLLEDHRKEQLVFFLVLKKLLNMPDLKIGLILCGTNNALPLLSHQEWADERITGILLNKWQDKVLDHKTYSTCNYQCCA